jgi:hypothetical protein
VILEVFDAQQNLVRRFSSEDKSAARHAPLPIAERWLPEPAKLEKSPGMHRFVWDLTSAGIAPSTEEEADFRSPHGPKVIPGIYQVRLTVNGQAQTQTLRVAMDPRSPATPAVLAQQYELGKQIYDASLETHRVLAEISSVQKQLAKSQQAPGAQSGQIKAALAEAQSAIGKILHSTGNTQEQGLQEAYSNLVSALRVVESGDRTVPSQAIALFQQSSQQIKARIAEWSTFKQTKLPGLNRQLSQGNLESLSIEAPSAEPSTD